MSHNSRTAFTYHKMCSSTATAQHKASDENIFTANYSICTTTHTHTRGSIIPIPIVPNTDNATNKEFDEETKWKKKNKQRRRRREMQRSEATKNKKETEWNKKRIIFFIIKFEMVRIVFDLLRLPFSSRALLSSHVFRVWLLFSFNSEFIIIIFPFNERQNVRKRAIAHLPWLSFWNTRTQQTAANTLILFFFCTLDFRHLNLWDHELILKYIYISLLSIQYTQ